MKAARLCRLPMFIANDYWQRRPRGPGRAVGAGKENVNSRMFEPFEAETMKRTSVVSGLVIKPLSCFLGGNESG